VAQRAVNAAAAAPCSRRLAHSGGPRSPKRAAPSSPGRTLRPPWNPCRHAGSRAALGAPSPPAGPTNRCGSTGPRAEARRFLSPPKPTALPHSFESRVGRPSLAAPAAFLPAAPKNLLRACPSRRGGTRYRAPFPQPKTKRPLVSGLRTLRVGRAWRLGARGSADRDRVAGALATHLRLAVPSPWGRRCSATRPRPPGLPCGLGADADPGDGVRRTPSPSTGAYRTKSNVPPFRHRLILSKITQIIPTDHDAGP
jgi:hypothetical protein